MKTWIKATCCLISVLSLVACRKSAATIKHAAEVTRQSRLQWNLDTLVAPYLQSGHTNSQWDEPARTALTEFARARAQSVAADENAAEIISNTCASALQAGCDDPLVRYLYIRYAMPQSESKEKFAEALCQTALAMEGTSYPYIRKYYAWIRVGDQIHYTYGYGTNIPLSVLRLNPWGQAESDLMNTLADKTMPPEEIYEASHELLNVWKADSNHYATLYQNIVASIADERAKAPAMLLLKGEAYIEMAWHARGSGYANTVTDDGWKLFAQRLDTAASALTKAWELDQTDPRVPLKMMNVELGQGQGRERMELWFDRAMKLDTNDYDACNYKLWYLEPKWHGSVEDMLAFGRECVQSTKWGGRIPLILVDAHVAIQNEFISDKDRAGYWKRPEVWSDLKSAYNRFFELYPDASGWYPNYAWYAYQAGDWPAFNDMVPKLGPANYDFFGGKTNFDRMLAEAKAGGSRGH